MRNILCFSILTLLITGCAYQGKQKTLYAELGVQWPQFTENPRIKLVDIIASPEDLFGEKTIFENVLRVLFGEADESLRLPYCIETTLDGKLFVVESTRRIISVFSTKDNDFYQIDADGNVFANPVDLAIDGSNGNIFVSDSEKGVIHLFSDWGKKYSKSFGGKTLVRPTGIAANNVTSELVIVDTILNSIFFYDIKTLELKRKIGERGDGHGQFNFPTHLFIDQHGEILVTDELNFRVQGFSSQGEFKFKIGMRGDAQGYLSRPKGVAADSDGNVYVVDSLMDIVQIFNKAGELLLVFGGQGDDYGEFWLPAGIFIDHADKVFVADMYNNRVQVFEYLNYNSTHETGH